MIRVWYMGTSMDVPAPVSARLGLLPGQTVTALQRADIIAASADERFERKRWAPDVVPARRVPLAALWLLLVFGVAVVVAGWVL